MGVDDNNNTDTGETGKRDQRCSQLCGDKRYSRGFTPEVLLKLAPCPPVWNKDLLWEVARKKGLSTNETNVIASKCSVPRATRSNLALSSASIHCEGWCIVLVLCGLAVFLVASIICMMIVLLRRRKRNHNVRRSRFRDTSRQNSQKPKSLGNINGVSNLGFIPEQDDVRRTDSNRSSRSTSELCSNAAPPGETAYYSNDNEGFCTIENGPYDTIDSAASSGTNTGSAMNHSTEIVNPGTADKDNLSTEVPPGGTAYNSYDNQGFCTIEDGPYDTIDSAASSGTNTGSAMNHSTEIVNPGTADKDNLSTVENSNTTDDRNPDTADDRDLDTTGDRNPDTTDYDTVYDTDNETNKMSDSDNNSTDLITAL